MINCIRFNGSYHTLETTPLLNKNTSSNLFSDKVCVLCPGVTPCIVHSTVVPYLGLALTMGKAGSHLHNMIYATAH